MFAEFNLQSVKARFTNGWRYLLWGAGEDADDGIDDEHYLQIRRSYRLIPSYWFALVFIGAFACAQATNYAGHSGLPWYSLTVTLIIAFVFTVVYSFFASRLGFVQFSSGGTGLYSLLASYMVPGNPVANMYCAMYGNNPQVSSELYRK